MTSTVNSVFQKRMEKKKNNEKSDFIVSFSRNRLKTTDHSLSSTTTYLSLDPNSRFHVKNWVSGSTRDRGKDKLNSTLFSNFLGEEFFGEKGRKCVIDDIG